mgnify:CR=1 FL=1
MEKILATIELDGVEGRGKLYYRNGDIWCILPDGTHQETHTGCTEDEAIDTIAAAWGLPAWDLQWTDESGVA